jgi:hypothetical protein
VKIRIPQRGARSSAEASTALAGPPLRPGSTFHAALTECAEDWVVRGNPAAAFTPRPAASVDTGLKHAPAQQAILARQNDTAVQPAAEGPVVRAWSWLQHKYKISATKRLRVAETVSLGEKRFVSIVSVEGREYLIGGGSTGVSLLAQLNPAAQATDSMRSMASRSMANGSMGIQGDWG